MTCEELDVDPREIEAEDYLSHLTVSELDEFEHRQAEGAEEVPEAVRRRYSEAA